MMLGEYWHVMTWLDADVDNSYVNIVGLNDP
jgi:hypothetical protein